MLVVFTRLTVSDKYCSQMMSSPSLGFDCSQSNGVPTYLPNTTVILNVSYCVIESFNGADYKEFPDLELLDLSGNLINDILPGIFNLPGLKYLNLSINILQRLPDFAFSNFLQLKTLCLEWNQISEVTFEAFGGIKTLEEINFGRNQLKAVPLALTNLPSLTNLTLSYNSLPTIDMSFFCLFPKLKYLDLSHNDELTSIYASNRSLCPKANISLDYLDLSYSSIQLIGINSLLSFHSIVLFKFYKNRNNDAEKCMEYVQTIDLSAANIYEAVLTISDLDSSSNPLKNSGLCHSFNLRKLHLNYAVTENTKINFDECFTTLEALTFNFEQNGPTCKPSSSVFYPNKFFSGLHNLKKLDLTSLNYISDGLNATQLPVLPNLEWLDYSGNYMYKLAQEAFHGLPALQFLDLSWNHLTDQYFSNTTFVGQQKLSILKINHNLLSRVDRLLSSISSLHYLELSHNLITTIQPQVFYKLTDLIWLYLGDCKIIKIAPPSLQFHSYSLKSLNELWLNKVKQLTFFKESLSFFSNIDSLNLENSKLYVTQDALLSLSRLQSVNLKNIDFSDQENMCKLFSSLLRSDTVKEIIASGMHMTNCPLANIQTPNLKILDLSNNKLSHFHLNQISNLPKLEKIVLSNNVLQNFVISSFLPSLNSIILNNNMISKTEWFSIDIFQPSILILELRNNGIIIIQSSFSILNVLKNFPNIEELYLDDSRVESISMQRKNVQLHSIFENSTKLLILTLSNSGINSIQKHFFVNLLNLEELDLSNNAITSLPVDLFLNNLKLVTLNLEGNSLKLVDEYINFVHLNSIENLYLKQEGTLDCDCRAADFQKWFFSRLSDIKFTRDGKLWDDFMCATPKDTPLLNCSLPICHAVYKYILWVILLLLSLFSIILFFIRKYSWVLRYHLYRFQKRYWKYSPLADCPKEDYMYDVFVSYSGWDLDWVKNELLVHLEPEFKVCIHDRDFMPGEAIVDNIEYSISKSKKTLLSPITLSSRVGASLKFALPCSFSLKATRIR